MHLAGPPPYRGGPRETARSPAVRAGRPGAQPAPESICRSDEGKGQNPPRGEAAAGAPTNSSLPGRLPLCGWWRCGFPRMRDPRLRNGGGRPPQRRQLPPRLKRAGAWRGHAGVTEARGPIGPRHRWSLWIVGRWPVLIPRFPGGAAPREPPFVGVSAGPDPSPEARMPQATQRSQGRTGGIPCVWTGV